MKGMRSWDQVWEPFKVACRCQQNVKTLALVVEIHEKFTKIFSLVVNKVLRIVKAKQKQLVCAALVLADSALLLQLFNKVLPHVEK